ncbi:MAG TPA: hypothetical protein PKD85_16385, partial [Saprospiraceae bacterium]|nr:hypothetical protein [Saprospiraceae bacterium]
ANASTLCVTLKRPLNQTTTFSEKDFYNYTFISTICFHSNNDYVDTPLLRYWFKSIFSYCHDTVDVIDRNSCLPFACKDF